ncbi:amastigote surface protein 4 [Trypanosoma cruzi]|nr:amastigote surface protein 4 [Trypanosoma cruzi]
MSRHVFTSAVLLLLVVVMMCCGSGAAAEIADEPSSDPNFEWKDLKSEGEGVTVDSLGVPGLLKVGSDVFAVAEAQLKKGENVFTGIASQLLTNRADNKPKELLEDAKDTQFLEEVTSTEGKKRVGVSQPTAVVKGSDIYMLVGKYNRNDAQESGAGEWGLLLVKGGVIAEGSSKKIGWTDTKRLPCTLGEEHESLTRLVGGGGSGVKLKDETLAFPVEGSKKKVNNKEKDGKAVSLILYYTATPSCTLSKGMSADGCSDPSVVEWKEGKLMMMTACDDGRRRVYESGDKGDSWTEALGTLSRVWGNRRDGDKANGVGSGFTTATIENRDVMLVTLLVYSSKNGSVEKGVLYLWLTDNTHIVDIGPVSGDDDVAASSLLYKSGDNNKDKKEELIALYKKKKGEGEKPSLGIVSVLLTAQLKRVKDVLTTWKEVDERVSKLCLTSTAAKNPSTGTACTTDKITTGLVGFLSGNLSGNTWRDEYLGVNATVKSGVGVEKTENGVTFKGRGAWAEWPVGSQGQNQLYHFANYNFTLVATVSIHKVPEEGSPIPLIGVGINDAENPVLLGLSYNKEKKWRRMCSGEPKFKEHSNSWEPDTTYQVAIVLQNGSQGSVYVDGQRVGSVQCELKKAELKKVSHFSIGGDGRSAEGQEGVSVTVRNVLLYNRPLTSEEIDALNPNKASIPPPVNTLVQGTVSPSTPGGQKPTGQESLRGVTGKNGKTAGGKDVQGEEGIHPQDREVNATALNSSLGKLSQENNSDGGTMRGSGLLLLLLLLGLWGFAAL